MSNRESQRLAVDVIARVDKLERGMAKAAQTTSKRMGQIERRTNRAASNIDRAMARANASMKGFGIGLIGGVIGGGLGGALANIGNELRSLAKTNDTAKMLGLHVERLQELRYAAEQAGMSANNFDVAFRRFTRRSSEAALGTGAAASAYKELGVSLTDSNGNLKDQDGLLSEVADKLAKLPNHADKLRLAFKFFDTDGAAMVNVLAKGSQGLQEMAADARSLGVVVEAALVQKAADADAAWSRATASMKGAFSSLAAEIGGDVAREFDSILQTVKEIKFSWESIKAGNFQDAVGMFWGKDAERQLANRQLRAGLGSQLTSGEAAEYYRATGMAKPPEPRAAPPGGGGGAGASMDKLVKSYADVEAIANQRLATMQMEQQALGMTTAAATALRVEFELLRTAEQMDVDLTPAQIASLKAKAAEMGALAAEAEKAADAQERLADIESMATGALSGMVSDLRAGVSAADAFSGALNRIADQLIEMAVRNLVANAFGNLLGGTSGTGGPLNLASFLKPFKDGAAVGLVTTDYMEALA